MKGVIPFFSALTNGRRIRWAALIFAILFTISSICQYLFVQHQARATRLSELNAWANELKKELAYEAKWNLTGFRRADINVPSFCVLTRRGLIVEIEGFVPGLISQVQMPQNSTYDRPRTITTETGESWRLLSRRVNGGTVVLGVVEPDDLTSVDNMLLANAQKFGGTLEDAMKVNARQTDQPVEYTVLDDSGALKYAIGGVPLEAMPAFPVPTHTLVREINNLAGRDYALYSTPVLDSSHNPVGTILIAKDITLERQALRNTNLFNVGIGTLSWAAVLILSGLYFVGEDRRRRIQDLSLEEALKQEESNTLEFKSSVRWDYKREMATPTPENEVVGTVAAFLNTDGGLLVIGVADNKDILGLQRDYGTLSLREGQSSRDGLELRLQTILTTAIGDACYGLNVRIEIREMGGKDVFLVRVKPSSSPVYVTVEEMKQVTVVEVRPDNKVEEVRKHAKIKQECLFIRTGGSTKALTVAEAIPYIQRHWKGYI
jgi:hypothetical protein